MTLLRLALGATGPSTSTSSARARAAGRLPRRGRRRRHQAQRRPRRRPARLRRAATTTSAARFTASGVLAAPVVVTRNRTRLAAPARRRRQRRQRQRRHGRPGDGRRREDAGRRRDVRRACRRTRSRSRPPASSACQLDARQRRQGPARRARRAVGDYATFAESIRTTDAFPKQATRRGRARRRHRHALSAQCKGAGMIQPNFATMLCFVQTDAVLPAPRPPTCCSASASSAPSTASRVDGQLSTNDTAILMASGASRRQGRAARPRTRARFGEALDALLRQLALLIVRDGEGAKRTGRVVVTGVAPERLRARRARGRQLAAGQGRAARRRPELGPDRAGRRRRAARQPRRCRSTSPSRTSSVCAERRRRPARRAALADAVAGPEVDYTVTLPGEGADAEVFFSDLSHDYVTINADYTT